MRILLTAHQFLPEYFSGTEILTYTTAKELQRRGHEVRVFTGAPSIPGAAENGLFDAYVHDGLPVERFHHAFVPLGEQSNLVEMEYDLHLVRDRFRDLLARARPHIVHFFHLSRISSAPIPVCRANGIPAFLTPTDFWCVCPTCQLRLPDNTVCPGPDPDAANCVRHLAALLGTRTAALFAKLPTGFSRAAVRIAGALPAHANPLLDMVRALAQRKPTIIGRVNQLDGIFVPSRVMHAVLSRHGVSPGIMRSCPFGIAPGSATIPRAGDAGGRLRVGYIGTLAEQKGVHVLVAAFRALAGRELELMIYGGLNDFPAYVARLRSLAAGDPRITFYGTFPNDEINGVLAGIDVLVVPSIWCENTPLVVLSAQEAGCPVIASDMAGLSEAIRHEENGLLFAAGDAAALQATVGRVAADRALLKRLSQACRKPRSVVDYVDQLEDSYTMALAHIRPQDGKIR